MCLRVSVSVSLCLCVCVFVFRGNEARSRDAAIAQWRFLPRVFRAEQVPRLWRHDHPRRRGGQFSSRLVMFGLVYSSLLMIAIPSLSGALP